MHAVNSFYGLFGKASGDIESEGRRGAFGVARTFVNDHPLVVDATLAAGIFGISTAWLFHLGDVSFGAVVLQIALTLPLAWRRARPSAVFAVIAIVALVQWSVDVRLFADVALLLALYTVAVRESLSRIVTAMVLLEVGIFLAAFRWHLADTGLLSVVYLTGLAAAALCAGLAVRSASQYLAWMEERAARLELEQDQRAVISAAEERARIAREMHDIVAHSLSVVVTLADAASVIGHSDPIRAETTMQQVADVGRQALGDMRTMLSALRTEGGDVDLGPQPGVADLESLYERVRGRDWLSKPP